MFYCELTGRLSKHNEPAHKLITHIRPIIYRRGDKILSEGWEVVKEIYVTKETLDETIASGFVPHKEKPTDKYLPFVKREDRVKY